MNYIVGCKLKSCLLIRWVVHEQLRGKSPVDTQHHIIHGSSFGWWCFIKPSFTINPTQGPSGRPFHDMGQNDTLLLLHSGFFIRPTAYTRLHFNHGRQHNNNPKVLQIECLMIFPQTSILTAFLTPGVPQCPWCHVAWRWVVGFQAWETSVAMKGSWQKWPTKFLQ